MNLTNSIYKLLLIIVYFFIVIFYPSISFSQENYEIRKIKIKGNKTFGKSDLLSVTSLHETNFIQRRFQKKEAALYSADMVEHDIERIITYYQSEGFLNVHLKQDSVKIVNEKKKRADLYLSIVESLPIEVDSISFSFTEPYPQVDMNSLLRRLPRRLNLKKSNRFTDNLLYSDIQKINNILINLGYVYTDTKFDLNLKYEQNLTDIAYSINSEIICQFGETTISGNKYIKDKIIKKQLTYISGQRFSQRELDNTRKHLYDLQLFRIVSIFPQKDKSTLRNPIPIQIKIEEMPRWITKFGIGWGTEDKFRAFADITYIGLFGGSSRLNLYLKHSALTPYYASLSWIQPQFYLKNLSVSVNPYIDRENEPGYNTQTLGLKLPTTYSLNSTTIISLTYYLEKVTQHLESSDADVPNPEDDKFLYNKSGISGLFTINNSYPIYYATRGWAISLGGKVNGYIFGTDFNYTKFWIDVRKYQRIKRFVLSGRIMIGGIHSSDENEFIPVEDRFYSGGSNSNRGWARAELGPKRESGTPLGGKSIIELNLEIRRHLFWRIDLAAFMDAGNIWEASYKYNLNESAFAAGGGLRIDTPIGPVRLDIGVPLWNEKKTVQFFISVGQAF